jgi:thioredoxin-related protein
MKYLSVFIIGIVLTLSCTAFASDEVKWFSLKEGMEKAKTENMPMIVDFFYGKGCPRCEKLETGVYSNPAIAKKIMADFVPIRVDLTKKLSKEEEALGKSYDFKNDCMLLFLDAQGNIIKDPGGKRLCFVDYVEPNAFIQYLDMIKGRLSNR